MADYQVSVIFSYPLDSFLFLGPMRCQTLDGRNVGVDDAKGKRSDCTRSPCGCHLMGRLKTNLSMQTLASLGLS